MRSFTILLVALVVTVGLCKGAAIEKGNKTAAEEVGPPDPSSLPCTTHPSLCGRKKREVKQGRAGGPPHPSSVPCVFHPEVCGRKKREVKQGRPEGPPDPSSIPCTLHPQLCGRKKREVKQEIPLEALPGLEALPAGIGKIPETVLTGRKKRSAEPDSREEDKPPNYPCPASICGRKKREVDVQESPEVSPSVGGCKDNPSLCGRKKREVEQESPVEHLVDPGRKKQEVEQISPVEAPVDPGRKKRDVEQLQGGLCPGAAKSLCVRKKREVEVQKSPVREDK